MFMPGVMCYHPSNNHGNFCGEILNGFEMALEKVPKMSGVQRPKT